MAASSEVHYLTLQNIDFPYLAKLYFKNLWLLKVSSKLSFKFILPNYTPIYCDLPFLLNFSKKLLESTHKKLEDCALQFFKHTSIRV